MSKIEAALADVARASVRVDRSKLAADVAVRTAIGVGIPLVVGLATGHTLIGVTASTGALSGGFASLQGTYRSRAEVVLVASAAMALSAFVGATVGHLFGPDIVVVAAWGFGAGLAVCLGQAATVVGVQSLVGLVVYSQFHLTAAVAAEEAGWVLAGGVVQTLLVVVVWPLRRFPAERRALSLAYDSLATFARSLVTTPTALLAPGALDALGPVMRDPQPFSREVDTAAHQALANQAERIRLELAAVARGRQRLGDHGEREAAGDVDLILQATSSVLAEVSDALHRARVPAGWDDERYQFETALHGLRATASSSRGARGAWTLATLDDTVRRCEALAGQLRAALRSAAIPAGGEATVLPGVGEAARPETGTIAEPGEPPAALCSRRRSPLRERVAVLRANLALSSQACRHGMRLAAALAVGEALSHAFSEAHRYWLPLTVMIVLKPDFSSTFTRGLSRVAGTLAGAGLVTVAVAELRPGHVALTALVVFWCWAAITTLLANYAIYSVCIASLVVTLLAFVGEPELHVAADRSLYTVVGAALALLAYALWPTWAAATLRDRLSDLVATEGRYGQEVLRAWVDPGRADRGGLQRARLNARLARSNAEAAVDRWLSEPASGDAPSRDTVVAVMAAVRNYVQGVLALHAQLPAGGPVRPEVGALADEVDDALGSVADAIRSGQSRARLPSLRSTQLALVRSLDAGEGATAVGGRRALDGAAVALASDTDLVVNAVNTLGHLVGVTEDVEQ
ncbi:MAG: FUSC family protein [Acidimicrobiales bacterium]